MAQQINLFNPLFLKREKHFSARTMVQALALLAVGVLGFYGYAAMQTASLQRVAFETEKRALAQREQLIQLGRQFSPQGRSKLLEDEAARLEARIKSRRDLLGVMEGGALGNTEGFSRFLAAFARRGMEGVWLVGLSISGDGSELLVNGRVLHAELVPAYASALHKEEVMRGRQVEELKLTAHEGAAAAPEGRQAAGPQRFVEFSMNLPRKPSAPGKGAS